MRHLVLGILFLASVASGQEVDRAQRVWVSDEAYALMGQKRFVDHRTPGLDPIYVIAPVFAEGRGGESGQTIAHDLVASLPPAQRADLEVRGRVMLLRPGRAATPSNSAWRVISTRYGDVPLLFAADTNGDGIAELLTSVQKIEEAVARGIASPEPAPVAFGSLLTLMRLR